MFTTAAATAGAGAEAPAVATVATVFRYCFFCIVFGKEVADEIEAAGGS